MAQAGTYCNLTLLPLPLYYAPRVLLPRSITCAHVKGLEALKKYQQRVGQVWPRTTLFCALPHSPFATGEHVGVDIGRVCPDRVLHAVQISVHSWVTAQPPVTKGDHRRGAFIAEKLAAGPETSLA